MRHFILALAASTLVLLAPGVMAKGPLKTPPKTQTLFELHCPGRTVMTVARAPGGLSTLSWQGHHFQVAAGLQRDRLSNGQTVTLTHFCNGDRLIVNADEGSVWFAFAGERRPVRCQRSESRESQVITLQTWYPGSSPTA